MTPDERSLTFRKRHPAVGARPGTLAIPAGSPPPKIHLFRYAPDFVEERDIEAVAELADEPGSEWMTWIDVQGLGDEAVLRSLGDMFGLHPLVVADVANVPQRPKSEAYDDYHVVITRMAMGWGEHELDIEQVSLIVGRNHLLTFQERGGDVFDAVRERLRHGEGRPIRRSGSDYLAYALADTVVDAYYPVLEDFGDYIEELETEVIGNPASDSIAKIYSLKRQLLMLRRSIWPQREMINAIIRAEGGFFTNTTRLYLRDTYDHCVQVIDVVESYREMAGGLLDVYLSSVSNRMNEVMKVLTIMASIFIPLTFIAGIYGMNFDFMPELQTRWAYPVVWVVMILTAGGMLVFFRRQGWLGSSRPSDSARDDDESPPSSS